MDLIGVTVIPCKERRSGVVHATVRSYFFRFGICVAVSAHVQAGVISPYITRKITGAFCTCAFSFWRFKTLTDRCFIIADLHAAAAVGTVHCQLIPFGAWL